MPVSLPIALPQGYDPDSADVQVVAGDVDNVLMSITWTVPASQTWLFMSMHGRYTSGGGGTRNAGVVLAQQDTTGTTSGGHYYTVVDDSGFGGASITEVSAGLGIDHMGFATGDGTQAIPLPWLTVPPAGFGRLFIDVVGAGDAGWNPLPPACLATVAVFSIDGTTGTGPEPVGPFMYVPGPSASAV